VDGRGGYFYLHSAFVFEVVGGEDDGGLAHGEDGGGLPVILADDWRCNVTGWIRSRQAADFCADLKAQALGGFVGLAAINVYPDIEILNVAYLVVGVDRDSGAGAHGGHLVVGGDGGEVGAAVHCLPVFKSPRSISRSFAVAVTVRKSKL
jgi:hypothetical protein